MYFQNIFILHIYYWINRCSKPIPDAPCIILPKNEPVKYATNLSIVRTEITKFNCERPFYVIFVIVMLNWKIWCEFLIDDGLVFEILRHHAYVKMST